MTDRSPKSAIPVTCTKCGTRLFAPASAAGKPAKCAKCGNLMRVPWAAPAETPPGPASPARLAAIPYDVVGAPRAAKAAPAPATKPVAPRPAKPAPVARPAPVGRPAAPTPAALVRPPEAKPSVPEWAKPTKPVRIWGQVTGGPPKPEEPPPEKPTLVKQVSAHARGAVGRIARDRVILGAVVGTVVIVAAVGLVAYHVWLAKPASAGANAWKTLEYSVRTLPQTKGPPDSKVMIGLKFALEFPNLKGLSGEDWEVRDSKDSSRAFYHVSFSVSEDGTRTGTLGFIASGDLRPESVSFRLKRDGRWMRLADVPSKP